MFLLVINVTNLKNNFMKFNLLILLAILSISRANSQSLTVFNVDPTNFPNIKANFFAFDANGKSIINFSTSDFEIKENGQIRKVSNVSCPMPKPPKEVSIAMSIDISGSMSISEAGEIPVELGKKTATDLCSMVAMPPSEFALQTCNDNALILQDFTTDKNKILTKINPIAASGGNDFVEQLANRVTGLLNIAKRGVNKRVAIIYTDAMWGALTDKVLQDCIDTCKKYDIQFYAIMYSKPDVEPFGIKSSLSALANATGGLLFDGILLMTAAQEIAVKLQQVTQGSEPCTIEWISEIQCPKNLVDVDVFLKTINANSKTFYSLPKNGIGYLEIIPSSLTIWNTPPGTSKDTTIIIKAINADFKITNIIASNPAFTILPTSFNLNANESKILTVTYTPKDSLINFCKFDIINDRCQTSIFARAGFHKQKYSNSTFRVTHPNGGEKFGIGTDTIITWEGCNPDELVSLEYSYDNGKTYNSITRNATGLKYNWKNIPNTPSTQCLLKATIGHNSDSNDVDVLGFGILNSVIINSAGSKIASCGTAGIFIWNISSGDTILSIRDNNMEVYCIAFSPDGNKIVSSGSDNLIKVWDVNSGAKIMTIDVKPQTINCLSFSPNGSMIASGGWFNEIALWDANTGTKIKTFKGHTGAILSIKFSPDGSRIVSGSRDQNIKLWDVNTGNEMNTMIGHTNEVLSVNFNYDGNKIVSASLDNTVKVWDANTGLEITTLSKFTWTILTACFSPDGSKIACSGDYTTIWDVNSGKEIQSLNAIQGNINNLTFTPDGNFIITGGLNEIKLWDVNTATEIKNFSGHNFWIYRVNFNPDGSKLVNSSWNGNVKLWDVNNKTVIRTLNKYSNDFLDVCFSPDGSKIAGGGDIDSISIWDVNTGAKIFSFKVQLAGSKSLSFSPDGSKIVNGSTDGKVTLWDVNTGSEILTFAGHNSNVFDVCFSPDGNKIASCSADGTIKIWNANTGVELKTILGHTDNVNCISFSPDGSTIVSGSRDRTLKLWSVNTGDEIFTMSGHTETINSVCFSPDGTKIASGSSDNTIKIWDSFTGKEINTLTGHSFYVSSVCFNNDGSKIASGSWDGTIRIWSLTDETAIEDTSDSLWAIVAPKSVTKEIDMLKVLVGAIKDSLVQSFIVNMSNYKSRIDSITIKGINFDQFDVISGKPPYILDGNETKNVEFRFSPKSIGVKTAQIYVYTAVDTIITNIRGEGVIPQLSIENNLIDFGKVFVGEYKDTIAVATIKNIGSSILTITDTKHDKPNDVDFSTQNGGGSFTINPGEIHKMNLRFSAREKGLTNGLLKFEYYGIGSPATIVLLGEGVINKPQISTISHNNGLLVCANSLLDTMMVLNSGKDTLNISEIKITGSDANDFTIIKNPAPAKLTNNDTVYVIYSFNPKTSGQKNVNFEIISNSIDSAKLVIPLVYEYVIIGVHSVNEIDLGEIYFSMIKDTTFNITNTGTSTNKYLINSSNNSFSITPSSIILTQNQSGQILLHYNGDITKDTILSFTISIQDTICGVKTLINVKVKFKTVPQISGNQVKGKSLICSDTLNDSVTIWNSGGDTLIISDISIIGADANDFVISNYSVPKKLLKTDSLTIFYSFIPKTSGIKIASIEITSNSGKLSKYLIPMSYDFETVGYTTIKDMDLGGILQAKTKDTSFSFTNTGSTSNSFVINSTDSRFTFTPNRLTLTPNQSEQIYLHYDGSINQDTTINFTVSITDSICGKSNFLTVKANIWSYKNITIESGNAEAKPGDTVTIQIYLRNGDFIKFTSINSIDFELVFNSTLLLPFDLLNQSSEVNGNRILTLSIPKENYSNGILTNLKMVAGLGNSTQTELKLQNLKVVGGVVNIDSVNGTFKLLGICPEGGKRLLNPTGTIKITSIKPNPSDNEIEVELQLVEKTGYKLIIVNSNGQTVREISRTNTSRSIALENIELSDLASGVYNLILQTESERMSKMFLIMK